MSIPAGGEADGEGWESFYWFQVDVSFVLHFSYGVRLYCFRRSVLRFLEDSGRCLQSHSVSEVARHEYLKEKIIYKVRGRG